MFVSAPFADTAISGILLTTVAMLWIIVLVRVVGLRSFSKMTNFDFVTTVAVGSLLAGAGQSTSWPAFLQTLSGIGALFLIQFTTAYFRRRSQAFDALVQNTPILLMREGKFLEPALRQTRVAKDDIYAKLREANVLSLEHVRAVVLETTGDISVLHGNQLSDVLLTGTEASK